MVKVEYRRGYTGHRDLSGGEIERIKNDVHDMYVDNPDEYDFDEEPDHWGDWYNSLTEEEALREGLECESRINRHGEERHTVCFENLSEFKYWLLRNNPDDFYHQPLYAETYGEDGKTITGFRYYASGNERAAYCGTWLVGDYVEIFGVFEDRKNVTEEAAETIRKAVNEKQKALDFLLEAPVLCRGVGAWSKEEIRKHYNDFFDVDPLLFGKDGEGFIKKSMEAFGHPAVKELKKNGVKTPKYLREKRWRPARPGKIMGMAKN